MRDEMTNTEYIENKYDCPDCDVYGNRCHCQYEETEQVGITWDRCPTRFGRQ